MVAEEAERLLGWEGMEGEVKGCWGATMGYVEEERQEIWGEKKGRKRAG